MTTTNRLDSEADVIANLTSLRDTGGLTASSLVIVVGDAGAEQVIGFVVDDVPADPPQHERVAVLEPFLHQMREVHAAHCVVLGVVRAGSDEVGGGDLAWHDAFTSMSRAADLTCHGVYLVTPREVSRIRPTSTQAA
ncbi:MAG TPA: hypothetical protein VFQ15_10215 [Jiangellaceae bacterium]|nr:hypothetical protein [Jiangellaceae bacterium]